MIPVKGLFETHLTVVDLNRSLVFYRDILAMLPDEPHREPGVLDWTRWSRRTGAAVASAIRHRQVGGLH